MRNRPGAPASLRAASVPSGARIQGFAEGALRIDGRLWREAVLLSEGDVCAASDDAIATVLNAAPSPEFLLIGSDDEAFSRHVTDLAERANVGVEAMGARAAAHGWVILRAEGRSIAAVIAPPCRSGFDGR